MAERWWAIGLEVTAPVETLETATTLVIGELASVHLQKVACGRECVTDSGEIGVAAGTASEGTLYV